MKVLGVDPGLNITGYGLVDATSDSLRCSATSSPRLIEAGVIRSKSSKPLEMRLLELFNGIEDIITEFRPDVLSVEELYSHYKHPRTAVIMGHARGVFFLVAGRASIPVFSYSATRIKKSLTGTGHASKEQIARMIKATLNCPDLKVVSDVTDAIAAALCHINAVSHGKAL